MPQISWCPWLLCWQLKIEKFIYHKLINSGPRPQGSRQEALTEIGQWASDTLSLRTIERSWSLGGDVTLEVEASDSEVMEEAGEGD